MTLERQLQVLIEEAESNGIAPIVIEKAVAPVLQLIAEQLEHLEYYVLQNMQEDWVISVIKDRQVPSSEKKVIYTFSTIKDAKNFSTRGQSNLIATSLPVVQILFRIFSLEQIDSAIFFPRSGNTTQGIEVKRKDLQNAIEQQLLLLKTTPQDLA